MENKIKLEEYDLVSFMMKVQQAILDGYELTDSSDDAPMCIGHCYHAIMREAAKPTTVVSKASVELSFDTSRLKEQLKAGGEIEQVLADSLIVEEKLHETFIDLEKDADKWDNKELGADEAYIETIEPPKEPTIDESLPKDEQVIEQVTQTPIKATQKPTRGKK